MSNGLVLDPLQDGKSRLELIDYMGNDLSVVNDARASFDKASEELTVKDVKLIKYLITHQHFSPFRGVVFKFKVKAPLYVCRQWFKHLLASNHNDEQFGWNEKSFRYTTINDSDEFYIPEIFRQQSKDNKQATEGELSVLANCTAIEIYKKECESSYLAYHKLLNLGVGREQARGILVPSVYTSWVWTVSLQALMNFVALRLGDGSQSEIKKYAECILELVTPIVPESVEAWMKVLREEK
jgi:thymidylate synthase (FAD)